MIVCDSIAATSAKLYINAVPYIYLIDVYLARDERLCIRIHTYGSSNNEKKKKERKKKVDYYNAHTILHRVFILFLSAEMM